VALIAVENLTHTYAGRGTAAVQALKGVGLSLAEGEYVAVIGANGSGKTTLALHLDALLQPSSGRVLVDGLDTADGNQTREIRRRVAMIFQSPLDQVVGTIAEEDVAFGPENFGVPSTDLPGVVRRSLERVGLWAERLRPPHLLSAGEQQRLAIAAALAVNPRCLVLDEATSMLDPTGAAALLDLIDELNRGGMTIVSITHRMEEAARARTARGREHQSVPPPSSYWVDRPPDGTSERTNRQNGVAPRAAWRCRAREGQHTTWLGTG